MKMISYWLDTAAPFASATPGHSLLHLFPGLTDTRIDYCWGGMVDMTRDRLPRDLVKWP